MAANSLASQFSVAPPCRALGVSRATFYRRQRTTPGRQQPRTTPTWGLCEAERKRVLDTLAPRRIVDRSPDEVVATLLDEGQYLCTERTMYRSGTANQPVGERRSQLTHPHYAKPELVVTAPNQPCSWDIARLLGPKHWTYYYLYVLANIFNRYVVGRMVAERESSALATKLIEQSCVKQDIEPHTLTLHWDRGAPMTSRCTAQLLADLGVSRSLSRPQVSDDNPFSEAQFKTLKYHPSFPERFDDIAATIAFCCSFFPWYNTEHRHTGIAMFTPHDVHYGRARRVLEKRERTLRLAWSRHPERFVNGRLKPRPLPQEVWNNAQAAATTRQPAQKIQIAAVSMWLTGSASHQHLQGNAMGISTFGPYRKRYGSRGPKPPDDNTHHPDQERLLDIPDGVQLFFDAPYPVRAEDLDPSETAPNNDKRCLWVVRSKDVPFIRERVSVSPPLHSGVCKHTNLTGGQDAHCGGEVWFVSNKRLVLNGASGRYPPRKAAELEEIAIAFQAAGYEVWCMGWDSETDEPVRVARGSPPWEITN